MALQRVPLADFRGGLNLRDGPFDLQANESPDLLNVTLTALVGQLQMRAGKTQFDNGTYPGGRLDNARQFAMGNGTMWLMCSIGGKIYSCSSAGAFVLRFTGTAGTVWDFAQMQDGSAADRVWCSNGVDAPQKWDGVTPTTSAWAGTPPNGKRLLVWKNKLVVAQASTFPGQRIFLSQFGAPENTSTPASYDFIDLRGPEDELDIVTELNVLGDRLYCFKRRSVWVVPDPTTGASRRLGEPGCYGRFQSDVSEGKLYFLNEQGIWSTGGVAVEFESGQISPYFTSTVNLAQLGLARLVATRDAYPRVLVMLPTGTATTNTAMIELVPHINFRRIGGRRYLLLPAFMLHTYPASCLASFKPANQWILVGGDDTGVNKLYQYFHGLTDDGVAITARWQSSWLSIQGQEPLERIRRLNVDISGDAIMDVFKDFGVSPAFSATLPAAGGVIDAGTWAPGVWGNVPWDPQNTYRFARLRPETRGRYHSVRIRNLPGGAPFVVNAMELAIRGGKEITG